MKYKINYNSFGGSSSSLNSSFSNNRYQDIELKYIFDNDSLRDAVNEWCDNNQEARIKYGDINTWDVSQVTDMIKLFRRKKQFNDNISNWDTSNVTNMSKMFYDTDNFNQDIYTRVLPDGKVAWDVSNVTNMSQMFSYAESFNGNISNWNTSNVTDMDSMFLRANSFNQDIGNWNTSNVTDMRAMFGRTIEFNQDIGNWNTSNVIIMNSMFDGSAFSNNRIALWPININHLSYNNMFNNSGITKNSFVDRNNDKIIPYNRLIAKYFNLPEEYMSIRVIEIGTKINHNINVNPIDRIIDVKKKLRNDIQQKTYTPYLQRFIFGGKELDNNRTLISYKIINDSTLYLLLMDHIVIYVKDLSAKTYTFNVNPEDTIQSVKESIRIENDIPIERQRLIFNSEELSNIRSLYYYNIINESELNLVLRIE